ncbi:MAG TPA: hypothetical protein VG429_02440 [Casimicrobiaceae bacterium]|jgi:hypothetical protein|nr:hypothetical protein [Casimicrobiaceae bacterium]
MDHLRTFVVWMLCGAWLVTGACWAAERPYTDGSVWTATFVRVKPGMGNTYLRDLASSWKQVMDEARKQQLIVSYKILGGDPGNRNDWNLILLVESKNWAAFDGADDKFDALVEKLVGSETKQTEMMVKRSDVREILGSRNLQEIILR